MASSRNWLLSSSQDRFLSLYGGALRYTYSTLHTKTILIPNCPFEQVHGIKGNSKSPLLWHGLADVGRAVKWRPPEQVVISDLPRWNTPHSQKYISYMHTCMLSWCIFGYPLGGMYIVYCKIGSLVTGHVVEWAANLSNSANKKPYLKLHQDFTW